MSIASQYIRGKAKVKYTKGKGMTVAVNAGLPFEELAVSLIDRISTPTDNIANVATISTVLSVSVT